MHVFAYIEKKNKMKNPENKYDNVEILILKFLSIVHIV